MIYYTNAPKDYDYRFVTELDPDVGRLTSGLDGNAAQVELRSVGALGSNVGQPEIFCDDNIRHQSFEAWKPMDQQVRFYRGLPLDPKPAKG